MPVLQNARWERFCVEHICNAKSAFDAYALAGFKPNEGNCIRLKRNPLVAARIQELKEEIAERALLTRTELLGHLQPLITVKAGAFFNADGTPKLVTELDDDCQAALAAVEVETRTTGSGKKKRRYAVVTKFKRWNKEAAVLAYARIAGHLREKVELSGPDGGPIPIKGWDAMSRAEKLSIARNVAFILQGARCDARP